MAMKLWICSGLLVLILAPSGCSRQREMPDYDALRSKLAVQLKPIDGWSAAEMEHSPIELKGLRISRMTSLVWRSYKSQVTGEEVWLTVDAGRWGHVARHLPIRISCLTGTGNPASFPNMANSSPCRSNQTPASHIGLDVAKKFAPTLGGYSGRKQLAENGLAHGLHQIQFRLPITATRSSSRSSLRRAGPSVTYRRTQDG
jgi:hypothetical protein